MAKKPLLPLVSSERVVRALEKIGCTFPRIADGTHLAVNRMTAKGPLTQTVPLNKPEVKRGTLETILKGLEITEDEFRLALGGQYARAVTRRLKRNTK